VFSSCCDGRKVAIRAMATRSSIRMNPRTFHSRAAGYAFH
jgi:hypothetical protein